MGEHEKISELFARYLDGRSSAEEILLLLRCFDDEKNEPLLKRLILACLEMNGRSGEEKTIAGEQPDAVYQRIKRELREQSG